MGTTASHMPGVSWGLSQCQRPRLILDSRPETVLGWVVSCRDAGLECPLGFVLMGRSRRCGHSKRLQACGPRAEVWAGWEALPCAGGVVSAQEEQGGPPRAALASHV